MPKKREAVLDPWIIEKIKEEERKKREKEDRDRPRVDLPLPEDDPYENPEEPTPKENPDKGNVIIIDTGIEETNEK